MQKLEAHLQRKMQILYGRNLHCPVVPGTTDVERARSHDRLLPPLPCLGPHQQETRGRQRIDIDGDLYDILVDKSARTPKSPMTRSGRL